MGLKTPSRVRIPHSPPLLDSIGFPRGITEKILTKWLTKQTCYCKIPLLFKAPVAQLDRAPGYELGGRRFESFRARQNNRSTSERSLVFLCPQVLCRGGACASPAANTRSVGRCRGAMTAWGSALARTSDIASAPVAPRIARERALTKALCAISIARVGFEARALAVGWTPGCLRQRRAASPDRLRVARRPRRPAGSP